MMSSHAVPDRYSSAPVFHVGQPTIRPSYLDKSLASSSPMSVASTPAASAMVVAAVSVFPVCVAKKTPNVCGLHPGRLRNGSRSRFRVPRLRRKEDAHCFSGCASSSLSLTGDAAGRRRSDERLADAGTPVAYSSRGQRRQRSHDDEAAQWTVSLLAADNIASGRHVNGDAQSRRTVKELGKIGEPQWVGQNS